MELVQELGVDEVQSIHCSPTDGVESPLYEPGESINWPPCTSEPEIVGWPVGVTGVACAIPDSGPAKAAAASAMSPKLRMRSEFIGK
jgi:hypothetical protein